MRTRSNFRCPAYVVVVFVFVCIVIMVKMQEARRKFSRANPVEDESSDTVSSRLVGLSSSQIIYLDSYHVALNSDETSDPENTSGITNLGGRSEAQETHDEIMKVSEVAEENNEAERDETIDYNLGWPEATTTSLTRSPCELDRPERNIILVKTHRTGTSTLANILYRAGDLNNLQFALPKRKTYEFYWPLRFNPSFVDKQYLNASRPNLLINAKYEQSAMSMMIGKEAYFIAILREPTTHFESAFYSYRLDALLGLENATNPLQAFLTSPHEHVEKYLKGTKRVDPSLNAAVNGQFFDLGLMHKYFSDDHVINSTMAELSKALDLVLISEYFDESLVLLTRLLCWELDDVVYFRLRNRANDYRELDITAEMQKRILAWNKADVALYQHFNKTLWERIGKQDGSFHDDVLKLKEKVRQLEEECVESYKVDANTGELVVNIYSDLPPDNRYLCDKIAMSEENYIIYLKRKMSVKFAADSAFIRELYRMKETEGNTTLP